MLLTQQGGFIIKPIAKLLGAILNVLYNALTSVGIVNIGVAIILFTVLARLCLLVPLIKQNKSTKVMNYIQPEVNKINKKYKGKKDQDSVLKQQKELRELQDKYGVSMTGGCLTSLIQMPIFLALYRVVQNFPAYVSKIYDYYSPIAEAIKADEGAIKAFQDFHQNGEYASSIKAIKLDISNVDTFIDVLAKLPSDALEGLKTLFASNPDIVNAINNNADKIKHVYSFIGGIDLSRIPGFALTAAFAIPVLSMVFQYLSMKVTPQQASDDPTQQATMKTMNMMLRIFPIMSFIVCVNVPAGVGLYWATGSFLSFLTTICINAYFKNCDMEKVVEKCKAKAAIKNEKKKASGKKSFMERMQEAALGQAESQGTQLNNRVSSTSLKSYTSNTMNNSGEVKKYREGSLAAKANLLQRYNDSNNKNK
ncbi:MAG: YidC/Oxa1 family membrane protein insertase [Lachnospiraceae bacterium]|nr:YidC/Oxa1 family membrane protein insertase [Lachnospiraceae bacterium]